MGYRLRVYIFYGSDRRSNSNLIISNLQLYCKLLYNTTL